MNELLNIKIVFRSIQFDIDTYRNGTITCFILYAWYKDGYIWPDNYTATNTDDFIVRTIKSCIQSTIVDEVVPTNERDVLHLRKRLPKNKVQVDITPLIPPIGTDEYEDLKEDVPVFSVELYSNGQLVDENGNPDFDWHKVFHHEIDNQADSLGDIKKYRCFFATQMLNQEKALEILIPGITYKFDYTKIQCGDFLLTSKHIISKVRNVGGAYIEMADGTSDYSDALRPVYSGVLEIENLPPEIFKDVLRLFDELDLKNCNYAHLIQEYIREKYKIEVPLANDRLSILNVDSVEA